MTRELVRQGAPPPQALVISGVRAAHLRRTEPDLHLLPNAELVAQLDARYGGIPPELRDNRALLDLVLPALRADLRVYDTFPLIGPTPLALPILALGGESDPVVSCEQILAWREPTTTFAAHFFAGGHFFPNTAQRAVTARVRDFLAKFYPARICCGGL